MGQPSSFEQSYQMQLPDHVKQEAEVRHEQILVVADKHAFLVGIDFIYPYIKGPVIGFFLLALWFGAKPAWHATLAKLRPK